VPMTLLLKRWIYYSVLTDFIRNFLATSITCYDSYIIFFITYMPVTNNVSQKTRTPDRRTFSSNSNNYGQYQKILVRCVNIASHHWSRIRVHKCVFCVLLFDCAYKTPSFQRHYK